jgi:hypothetical protein
MRSGPALAFVLGCSGTTAQPDAWQCWPGQLDIPATGDATLGTGVETFEPLGDTLPIVYGVQDGFNVVANVKMRGMSPGNPDDIYDPRNPHTRILSYFADTGVPLNKTALCAYSVGYKRGEGDTFVMPGGVGVIFDTCWRKEHLLGRPLRITLELLDANRVLAKDERTVTMVAPTTGTLPDSPGHPGCPP